MSDQQNKAAKLKEAREAITAALEYIPPSRKDDREKVKAAYHLILEVEENI